MSCTDPHAILAARQYSPRFLELCDPDHPDYEPAYLDLARRMIAGSIEPPAPRSEAIEATEWPPCDYRETCSCSSPRCFHLANGEKFAHHEVITQKDQSPFTYYRVSPSICANCIEAARSVNLDKDQA